MLEAAAESGDNDVATYKDELNEAYAEIDALRRARNEVLQTAPDADDAANDAETVSYTHLTLPTIYSV